MTATDNNNKATRQTRLRRVLAGLETHFQGTASLQLGGVTYNLADLKALFQKDIDAADATVKARAEVATVVQAERNMHTRVNPVLRYLKSIVLGLHGDTVDASNILADFGYTPRKSTKKTVATKSDAIVKSKATRAARHTAGKRQKAKVKGTTSPAPAASTAGTAAPSPTPKPTASGS
jgi:hypothetical protein